MNDQGAEPCRGCGLLVAGGTGGCRALLDGLLARDFSDVAYFRVHRLLVDVYCLQHPDEYCVSFKSLAAHLMHVCWSLEHGGTSAVPNDRLRRWVERHPRLAKPDLPAFRGALTVANVAEAPDAETHGRAVREWALATWKAYHGLHQAAREWVRLALGGRGSA